MNTEKALQIADTILGEFRIISQRPENHRLDVKIAPLNLKSAVEKLLVEKRWGYLSAITGLDYPEYSQDAETGEQRILAGEGNIEILYHFCEGEAVLTLRIMLPYNDLNIDSICPIAPVATLYEREAMELLGVNFINTPVRDRLILPDDWPAGVYPLRKSFTSLEASAKKPEGAK